MTVALVVVIALIAVGLPLGAFWLGGRRFWGRLRGRPLPADRQGALYREVVLRHHLRPSEIAQVEGAVTWGKELTDPRLRAAVVDWAQQLRTDAARRRAVHPRRRRLLLALTALWLVAAVVGTGIAAADGDWGALVRLVLYAAAFGVPAYLAVRGPRRALERNSGPPTGSEPSAGLLGE